jgi:hypothetical protein
MATSPFILALLFKNAQIKTPPDHAQSGGASVKNKNRTVLF